MRVKYTEMAGKSRQKSAANVAESVTLSLNERILKDCHSLYTDAENGENVAYGKLLTHNAGKAAKGVGVIFPCARN